MGLGKTTPDKLMRYIGKIARLNKFEPYEIWPEETDSFPPYPFPLMGAYIPEDWYVTDFFLARISAPPEGVPTPMHGSRMTNFGNYPYEASIGFDEVKLRLKVGRAYGVVYLDKKTIRIAEYSFRG